MTIEETCKRVIEILKAEFPTLRKLQLSPETALLSAGLIDSFGIVTLLSTLEAEFGVDLDVEKIPLEQFETPRSISALCAPRGDETRA